jgi:hypothetical protein
VTAEASPPIDRCRSESKSKSKKKKRKTVKEPKKATDLLTLASDLLKSGARASGSGVQNLMCRDQFVTMISEVEMGVDQILSPSGDSSDSDDGTGGDIILHPGSDSTDSGTGSDTILQPWDQFKGSVRQSKPRFGLPDGTSAAWTSAAVGGGTTPESPARARKGEARGSAACDRPAPAPAATIDTLTVPELKAKLREHDLPTAGANSSGR